ncbi:metallopeptidase TldD-related protein [Speluncibacter jeojiensis]|uniref:Metallopeptidase TldD-related protein n=1 Tax=Speluncibacter jeojiensis TaxID=2710754 RepID=A0A9X4RFX4_9ACTN|nr:metallopeptidase TldD-related protein [Corynebacteriales bacterium D3-21]
MLPGQELVERALALATVDALTVLVTDTSEASLRWAGNSMTTNGVSTRRSWTVIAVHGAPAAAGVVTASTVDPDEIAAVVRSAEEAARRTEPATDAAPLIAPAGGVDQQWSARAAATDIGVFDRIADGLADGFARSDAAGSAEPQLYGFAQHEVRTTWLGSTSGLRRRFDEPIGSVEINGKRTVDGHPASAWVGAGSPDLTGVNVPAMLAELDTRLGWSRRTVELPAGRYETVLPPSTVADLMIPLLWAMSGRGAHEGRNAFARPGGTRVGERLAAMPLTLSSDPALGGLEYAPFVAVTSSTDDVSVFDNGMDATAVDWIRDGTLGALAYPRSGATEFAAPVAVPGENLALTGGSCASLHEMVAATERGLLLTTLWYIREVDPATLLLTGLTRDGVYLIEDGRVTAAVNNFRFNESPLDLLRRATEAGATERTLPREWKDWFTRTAMPPLRIPDFHMSSVSRAQ